ncbi:hypothetical protein DYH55_04995 [Methylovirgula sp. 4M-Z18]|nr:hypothetical protein DYH55_04995 [Methylovirgula sp. 4M-Z18]
MFITALIACCALAEPVAAQTPPGTPATAALAPKVSLSKYRARRIRHNCEKLERNKNLGGSEYRAYMKQCFEHEAAERAERVTCREQGRAKGIANLNALNDYVRECAAQRKKP